MRWNRGVAEVEIGDKLLHGCFGLDVSGSGSDRVRDGIAWRRKGDSIVRPGIPLSLKSVLNRYPIEALEIRNFRIANHPGITWIHPKRCKSGAQTRAGKVQLEVKPG
jgi:hypothetical protein